jgi:hypothetical protein
MTPATLDLLTQRFRDYVDRYRVDGALHPMHQLKLEHTIRVAADARAIATGMNWPEEEVCLAEAVGLFHDVARFPQFQQYRSFSDAETIDHGDLGARILDRSGSGSASGILQTKQPAGEWQKENLLEGIADEPRALILHSVQHHNKKDLPRILTAHEEKHLRLIRDADRLDIFFICWDSFQSGHVHEHPEIIMGIDFNGPPTGAILDQFERGETIDYRNINSMTDRFVLQLSWMHDLSYDSSKRLVRERGILEKFMDVMPVKTDRLLSCFEKTASFLAEG